MIVCLCAGSSDRDVHNAIEAGVRTLSEIGEACGAGSDCGGCHSALRAILEHHSCESCPRRDTRRCDRLASSSIPEIVSV